MSKDAGGGGAGAAAPGVCAPLARSRGPPNLSGLDLLELPVDAARGRVTWPAANTPLALAITARQMSSPEAEPLEKLIQRWPPVGQNDWTYPSGPCPADAVPAADEVAGGVEAMVWKSASLSPGRSQMGLAPAPRSRRRTCARRRRGRRRWRDRSSSPRRRRRPSRRPRWPGRRRRRRCRRRGVVHLGAGVGVDGGDEHVLARRHEPDRGAGEEEPAVVGDAAEDERRRPRVALVAVLQALEPHLACRGGSAWPSRRRSCRRLPWLEPVT